MQKISCISNINNKIKFLYIKIKYRKMYLSK